MPIDEATRAREAYEPLEAIIDEAIEAADGDSISLRGLLAAWGDRSYGPLFVILGFIAGTPLAIVPGAAALVAVVIILLALQMVVGFRYPWMPEFLMAKTIAVEKVRHAQQQSLPYMKAIDRFITQRMTWAVNAVMRRIAAFLVLIISILMIPLDAVPFIVAAPAWTVVLFGLALTARDGLLLLVAVAASGGVGYLAWSVLG